MAKIVFMGTPDFAVATLRALIENHEVIGVVTQPDRPAGRNRQPQASPVKQAAVEAGIAVFQPEKLRRSEAIETLKQWTPDAYVVTAFGQILPQAVLDIPRYGSINVHASLLPRWRGAAPLRHRRQLVLPADGARHRRHARRHGPREAHPRRDALDHGRPPARRRVRRRPRPRPRAVGGLLRVRSC